MNKYINNMNKFTHKDIFLNNISTFWSTLKRNQYMSSCVCFVDSCLSFCPLSLGHCVVCPSIYGFWLLLWYLQTLLHGYSSILWCSLRFSRKNYVRFDFTSTCFVDVPALFTLFVFIYAYCCLCRFHYDMMFLLFNCNNTKY
jgi:uncharacterized membrane protein